MKLQPYYILEA